MNGVLRNQEGERNVGGEREKEYGKIQHKNAQQHKLSRIPSRIEASGSSYTIKLSNNRNSELHTMIGN